MRTPTGGDSLDNRLGLRLPVCAAPPEFSERGAASVKNYPMALVEILEYFPEYFNPDPQTP